MKFGFVTCVDVGISCIDEIYKIGGKLDLLITLEDDTAKNKSSRAFLDDVAAAHNVDLLKIKHINDSVVIDKIGQRKIDWLFIIGWSQIAGSDVLAAPKLGCIGMHPTLLPIGRGRAPIPWAIIKGLDKTGVTLFKLDSGVDSGPILSQIELPLSSSETATTLHDRINDSIRAIMRKVWPTLINNSYQLVTQNDEDATYWPGRKPKDGLLSTTMSCAEVDRLVRGLAPPFPGAFVEVDERHYIISHGEMVYDGIEGDVEIQRDRVTMRCSDGFYCGVVSRMVSKVV
jgi:methionyl-tRNA formyltransferase